MKKEVLYFRPFVAWLRWFSTIFTHLCLRGCWWKESIFTLSWSKSSQSENSICLTWWWDGVRIFIFWRSDHICHVQFAWIRDPFNKLFWLREVITYKYRHKTYLVFLKIVSYKIPIFSLFIQSARLIFRD